MKLNNKLIKSLVFVGLVAVAIPASAVSYHGSYHAFRRGGAGNTFFVLPTNNHHFCYLSKVKVEETDRVNECA